LPPHLRVDWIREWHAEFWHSLNDHGMARDSHLTRQMRARALGAFADAWTLLRLECGIRQRIRRAVESRSAPIFIMALLLITLASGTRGFSGVRSLWSDKDSESLALVVQPDPFLRESSLMPAAQADAWFQRSKTVLEMGKWTLEDRTLSGKDVRVLRADATAISLLSKSPMRLKFDRIESIEGFAPTRMAVVARLRSGATSLDAERELAIITGLGKGWLRPTVLPLTAIRNAPLHLVVPLILGLLVFSVLPIRAFHLQAWPWVITKPVLCFMLVSSAWLEIVARTPLTETAQVSALWNLLLYLLPVLASASAAWWFRWDAANRCHTCYRLWATPISVGSPGRCLFEPQGVGYQCDEGHGALSVGPFAAYLAVGAGR
jgi:hypothetical protein